MLKLFRQVLASQKSIQRPYNLSGGRPTSDMIVWLKISLHMQAQGSRRHHRWQSCSEHAHAWPAVVVAVGDVGNGGKGVALLSVLGLGGAPLIPHGAAQTRWPA